MNTTYIYDRQKVVAVLFSIIFLMSCGGASENNSTAKEPLAEETEEIVEAVADPMDNKGIGPVNQVELAAVDQQLATEGKTIFEEKCTACHKVEQRYIGPPMKEVTTRRSPEWIMNMILNPEEMVKKDPIAKALLAEYLSPMANQNLTRDQARKILEYFRSVDEVNN